MVVIAVVGFPKAGKTTWLNQVAYYRHLRSGDRFFIQRACPDGEGVWTSESIFGKELARRCKVSFNREFVEWVKTSAMNLSKIFDIIYLDCGGKQSKENEEILRLADRVVIVAKSFEDAMSWLEFARKVKPDIEATWVISRYDEGSKRMYFIEAAEL